MELRPRSKAVGKWPPRALSDRALAVGARVGRSGGAALRHSSSGAEKRLARPRRSLHSTHYKAPVVRSRGPGEEPPRKPKALLGPDHRAQLPGLISEDAGPQRLTHSLKAEGVSGWIKTRGIPLISLAVTEAFLLCLILWKEIP